MPIDPDLKTMLNRALPGLTLLSILVAGFGGRAHAAPSLVRDISNGDVGSFPAPLGVANGKLVFSVRVPAGAVNNYASALWSTDGTEAGTVTVAGAWESNWGAWFTGATAVNGRLFFVLQRQGSSQLWVSDGTSDGTRELRDLTRNGNNAYPVPTAINERLFFAAADAEHGAELWASDGTADGTTLAIDVAPGAASSDPASLTVVDGRLLFTAVGPSGTRELWASDGTVDGTVQLSDVATSDPGTQVVALTGAPHAVYFSVGSESAGVPQSLWKSDGTSLGAIKLANLPGPIAVAPVDAGSDVFFAAFDEDGGVALWASDGTPSGTRRMSTIVPADDPRELLALTAFSGRVFFATCVPSEFAPCQLWHSDGTAVGTFVVTEFDMGFAEGADGELSWSPPWLWNVNDRLLYAFVDPDGVRELWTSCGTPAGTVVVTVPGGGPYPTGAARQIGSTFYFSASDPTAGVELWRSDGTAAGTSRVADINPGIADAYPWSFTPFGDVVLFAAQDAAHGYELWRTDGTAVGTQLVRDIDTDGVGADPAELTAVGSDLFFSASDLTGGLGLWRSDGTESGTVRVDDVQGVSRARRLTAVGSTLFFVADEPPATTSLWHSDGSTAGTSRLADVSAGGAEVRALADVDGKLFLLTRSLDETTLWTSDGTVGGTTAVVRVPGHASCQCVAESSLLADVGGRVVFSAPTVDGCDAIWSSDGTADGTALVRQSCLTCMDCAATAGNGGDTLYFTNFVYPTTTVFATDGTSAGTHAVGSSRWPFRSLAELASSVFYGTGSTLWRSSPTGPAMMVADVATPGPIRELAGAGHDVFFTVDVIAGSRLWVSDGTPGGTTLLATVPSAWSVDLRAFDGLAFFGSGGVVDTQFGEELWMSDGTTPGTGRVADLNPGPRDSSPSPVVRIGDRVFFSANDGRHGRQLWGLPLCQDGIACPNPAPPPPWPPAGDEGPSTDGPQAHDGSPSVDAPAGGETSSSPGADGGAATDAPPSCSSCDDGDPCTIDRCEPSGCVHEHRTGLPGLRCALAGGRLRPAACRDERIPRIVRHRLKRAIAHVESGAPAGRTLRKAARALRKARGHGMSRGCEDALAAMIHVARKLIAR